MGKFTSCLPDLYIQNAGGQEIHDEEAALTSDIVPDRPDLARVSEMNGLRVSALPVNAKGKLLKQRHYLKIVPVSRVQVILSSNEHRQVFIIGTNSMVYDPRMRLQSEQTKLTNAVK